DPCVRAHLPPLPRRCAQRCCRCLSSHCPLAVLYKTSARCVPKKRDSLPRVLPVVAYQSKFAREIDISLEKFVIVQTPHRQDEICVILSGTSDLFAVTSVGILSDTSSYLSKPGSNIALKISRTISSSESSFMALLAPK